MAKVRAPKPGWGRLDLLRILRVAEKLDTARLAAQMPAAFDTFRRVARPTL